MTHSAGNGTIRNVPDNGKMGNPHKTHKKLHIRYSYTNPRETCFLHGNTPHSPQVRLILAQFFHYSYSYQSRRTKARPKTPRERGNGNFRLRLPVIRGSPGNLRTWGHGRPSGQDRSINITPCKRTIGDISGSWGPPGSARLTPEKCRRGSTTAAAPAEGGAGGAPREKAEGRARRGPPLRRHL